MIALLAMFALLVQALIPTMAGAAPSPLGDGAVICTSIGMQAAPSGDGAPAETPGGHCDHCVCPATAAPPPLPPGDVAQARAYARIEPSRPTAAPPPPARAPPRPPGQGPPTPNA